MCDEDARDEERNRFRALAEGRVHKVTLDITVRITVTALGSDHETDDLEDMVTDVALSEGEIVNIEEVQ
jgi:hypothetical protein